MSSGAETVHTSPGQSRDGTQSSNRGQGPAGKVFLVVKETLYRVGRRPWAGSWTSRVFQLLFAAQLLSFLVSGCVHYCCCSPWLKLPPCDCSQVDPSVRWDVTTRTWLRWVIGYLNVPSAISLVDGRASSLALLSWVTFALVLLLVVGTSMLGCSIAFVSRTPGWLLWTCRILIRMVFLPLFPSIVAAWFAPLRCSYSGLVHLPDGTVGTIGGPGVYPELSTIDTTLGTNLYPVRSSVVASLRSAASTTGTVQDQPLSFAGPAQCWASDSELFGPAVAAVVVAPALPIICLALALVPFTATPHVYDAFATPNPSSVFTVLINITLVILSQVFLPQLRFWQHVLQIAASGYAAWVLLRRRPFMWQSSNLLFGAILAATSWGGIIGFVVQQVQLSASHLVTAELMLVIGSPLIGIIAIAVLEWAFRRLFKSAVEGCVDVENIERGSWAAKSSHELLYKASQQHHDESRPRRRRPSRRNVAQQKSKADAGRASRLTSSTASGPAPMRRADTAARGGGVAGPPGQARNQSKLRQHGFYSSEEGEVVMEHPWVAELVARQVMQPEMARVDRQLGELIANGTVATLSEGGHGGGGRDPREGVMFGGGRADGGLLGAGAVDVGDDDAVTEAAPLALRLGPATLAKATVAGTVEKAESMWDSGTEEFPRSGWLWITYCMWLMEVASDPERATAALSAASRLELGWIDRITFHMADRHLSRARHSGGAASGMGLDLAGYVEFTRQMRFAMRAHRRVMMRIRAFWRLVVQLKDRRRAILQARAQLAVTRVVAKIRSSRVSATTPAGFAQVASVFTAALTSNSSNNETPAAHPPGQSITMKRKLTAAASLRVPLTRLSRLCFAVEQEANAAETVYRALVERYPSTPKVLRAAARFLMDVQLSQIEGERYMAEADRIEAEEAEQEDDGNGGRSLAARAGELSMTTAVDDATDALVVINSKGVILSANSNTRRMFGRSESDLVGRNVSILMPPHYAAQHDRFLSRYLATGVAHILGAVRRVEGLHRDGYTFPIEIAVNRVDTPQGVTFAGVIHQLREEEAAGHLTLSSKGIVVTCNRAFAKMFGWTVRSVTGKSVRRFMPSKDQTEYEQSLRRSSAGTAQVAGLTASWKSGLSKQGMIFPIAVEAAAQGTGEMATISCTITELASAHGVLTMDARGKVQSCNAALLALFGFKATSDIVGRPVTTLMPEPYATFHQSYIDRFLALGSGRIVGGDGRYVTGKRVDGQLIDIFLKVNAVLDAKGRKLFAADIELASKHLAAVNAEGDAASGKTGRQRRSSVGDRPDDGPLDAAADDPLLGRITTNEKGIIQFVNRQLLLMFGYKHERDMLGKNVKMVTPPDIAVMHDGFLERHAQGAPAKVVGTPGRHMLAAHSDGHLFPVSLCVEEERIGSSRVYHGSIRALAELEGVIYADFAGKILHANEALASLLGYKVTELLGKNVSMIMPKRFASKHDGYMARYRETGQAHFTGKRQIVPALHSDGSEVTVQAEVARITDPRFGDCLGGRFSAAAMSAEEAEAIVQQRLEEIKQQREGKALPQASAASVASSSSHARPSGGGSGGGGCPVMHRKQSSRGGGCPVTGMHSSDSSAASPSKRRMVVTTQRGKIEVSSSRGGPVGVPADAVEAQSSSGASDAAAMGSHDSEGGDVDIALASGTQMEPMSGGGVRSGTSSPSHKVVDLTEFASTNTEDELFGAVREVPGLLGPDGLVNAALLFSVSNGDPPFHGTLAESLPGTIASLDPLPPENSHLAPDPPMYKEDVPGRPSATENNGRVDLFKASMGIEEAHGEKTAKSGASNSAVSSEEGHREEPLADAVGAGMTLPSSTAGAPQHHAEGASEARGSSSHSAVHSASGRHMLPRHHHRSIVETESLDDVFFAGGAEGGVNPEDDGADDRSEVSESTSLALTGENKRSHRQRMKQLRRVKRAQLIRRSIASVRFAFRAALFTFAMFLAAEFIVSLVMLGTASVRLAYVSAAAERGAAVQSLATYARQLQVGAVSNDTNAVVSARINLWKTAERVRELGVGLEIGLGASFAAGAPSAQAREFYSSKLRIVTFDAAGQTPGYASLDMSVFDSISKLTQAAVLLAPGATVASTLSVSAGLGSATMSSIPSQLEFDSNWRMVMDNALTVSAASIQSAHIEALSAVASLAALQYLFTTVGVFFALLPFAASLVIIAPAIEKLDDDRQTMFRAFFLLPSSIVQRLANKVIKIGKTSGIRADGDDDKTSAMLGDDDDDDDDDDDEAEAEEEEDVEDLLGETLELDTRLDDEDDGSLFSTAHDLQDGYLAPANNSEQTLQVMPFGSKSTLRAGTEAGSNDLLASRNTVKSRVVRRVSQQRIEPMCGCGRSWRNRLKVLGKQDRLLLLVAVLVTLVAAQAVAGILTVWHALSSVQLADVTSFQVTEIRKLHFLAQELALSRSRTSDQTRFALPPSTSLHPLPPDVNAIRASLADSAAALMVLDNTLISGFSPEGCAPPKCAWGAEWRSLDDLSLLKSVGNDSATTINKPSFKLPSWGRYPFPSLNYSLFGSDGSLMKPLTNFGPLDVVASASWGTVHLSRAIHSRLMLRQCNPDSCLAQPHRFFIHSHIGLSALLRVTALQSFKFAGDDDLDLAPQNGRFELIDWATSYDLDTGYVEVRELLLADAAASMSSVQALRAVFFVGQLVALALAYRLVFGPIMSRVSTETTRVATFLSFLPAKVDLRKLVGATGTGGPALDLDGE
jgi:PAS domain S-box-containing protein